jgi:predicted TIM-barrel fold metal-dependent hydrolase
MEEEVRMKPPVLAHEEPYNAALAVVDTHVHLWDTLGYDFFVPELLAEIKASGHNIEATIYAECDMAHATTGPEALRPVGETAYAVSQAKLAEGAPTRINVGIMGASDLRLGAGIRAVMEAHIEAGQGRFRGIRYRGAWDADPRVRYNDASYPDREVLGDKNVLEGAKVLEEMGLVLGNWIFHPQLGLLTALAEKVPGLTMTLNHLAGPIGIGSYAAHRDEVYREWRAGLKKIAKCQNVVMQLGGIGGTRLGYPSSETGLSSDQIVRDWKPHIDFCLETFGPDRVVFDSNFPVDRRITSYGNYVNAFKKMIADYSPDEQVKIMSANAKRLYKIG